MHVIDDTVSVTDRTQQSCDYVLVAPTEGDFDRGFEPHRNPAEMLEMGV